MSLTVVEPAAITGAMVLANTLTEVYGTWNAGTTYADAARVVSSDGLSVYESLQAANLNHDPLADNPDAPVWWARVGASNRWALFDGEASLGSSASGGFVITLQPGAVGALGLIGMSGISQVRIQVVSATTGATARDTTHDLLAEGIDTPYEFFYSYPRPYATERVFLDLPTLSDAVVTLTFSGTTSMRLGELVVGTPYELGDALRGAGLGLTDYSVQTRDQWGRLTLRQGDFARTPSVPFLFRAERLNKVFALLSRFRGRACLYVPSAERRLAALTTLGIYTRMRIDLQTATHYYATLDIEGLAESA